MLCARVVQRPRGVLCRVDAASESLEHLNRWKALLAQPPSPAPTVSQTWGLGNSNSQLVHNFPYRPVTYSYLISSDFFGTTVFSGVTDRDGGVGNGGVNAGLASVPCFRACLLPRLRACTNAPLLCCRCCPSSRECSLSIIKVTSFPKTSITTRWNYRSTFRM